MRLRVAAATGALAVAAPLSLSGVAYAAPEAPTAPAEKDCKDYGSQKEAQKALDSDSADANRLDSDGDKKACEKWPPGPGDPSNAHKGEDHGKKPNGSVDAGGGGASGQAQDPAGIALPLSIAAGASLAAAGSVLVVRHYRARSDS